MLNSIRAGINHLNQLKYKYYIKLRYKNARWGNNIAIHGKFNISLQQSSRVTFGDNVKFSSHTIYNFVGIYKPVSIAVDKDAELTIGKNSGFSGTSIYAAKKITIGENCNFGGNTAIWDTDFHPLDYKARRIHDKSKIQKAAVTIGDDVFIGANTIILKGVTIGNRAIVGAGSVVSKNIPSDEIWAGNPARFIKKIE